LKSEPFSVVELFVADAEFEFASKLLAFFQNKGGLTMLNMVHKLAIKSVASVCMHHDTM